MIDAAKFFYLEGYFLTHGLESALYVAKKSSESGKVIYVRRKSSLSDHYMQVFAINLSAPFIAQFFKVQLEQILPYCDIVIGNEAEAEAWAESTGLPDKTDLANVARSLALSTKANPSRPRIVVFTHGAESTVVVSAADSDNAKVFPVHALKDEDIVDTNGAGDAFAGGFIGALVAGKSTDDAIEVGHKMGAMCVQQVRSLLCVLHHILLTPFQIGPQYKWPKVSVL